MKKCKFKKEEFYSTEENNKINLLCELYKEKKIEKISGEIETTLNLIIIDINKGEIEKKKIEEFLGNPEEVVKKRLGLLKICFEAFGPENAHDKLKNTLDSINEDINVLTYIKNALSKFQRERHQDNIREMVEIIKKLENIKIKEYNSDKIIDPIRRLRGLEKIAQQINSVKEFLLFKVIYDNTKGNNQEIRFGRANDKLEEIKKLFEKKLSVNEIYEKNKKNFDIIKEKIINNEKKSEQFFKSFKENFNIGDNKDLINDLTLLFNSKKYEMDLKSIIFFFKSFRKDDEWNKKLSNKYEKLSEMNLEDIKNNLNELKETGIYDYETKSNYSKIFTSLYDKKEAIDFLRSKINKGITELYDRIEPNNRTITIEKIDQTAKCIEVFNQFEAKKSNDEIFKYIKTLEDDKIKAFESYSKIYLSIIELDRNDYSTLNVFEPINKIIKCAKFIFKQDTEIFSYGEKGENDITMEDLIHLKNKINISSTKIKKETKDKPKKIEEKGSISDKNELLKEDKEKEIKKEKEDLLKVKREKLLYYKKLVSNMEVIYENMEVLKEMLYQLILK